MYKVYFTKGKETKLGNSFTTECMSICYRLSAIEYLKQNNYNDVIVTIVKE